MAKKINFADQRRKAAANLRVLGTILYRKGVCLDIGPLSGAAEQCAAAVGGRGDQSWGYDISNLVFRLQPMKGTVPAKTKDLRVELSIKMVGRFDCDPDDQFLDLEINLEKYAYTSAGAELKAAWHFDRHIIDTKKDDPLLTDDIHPLYHFQFGGAKMSQIANQLGGTFLLDPPRLMHPPMDGILAIDFVLANYAGLTWKALRDDAQYSKLIIPKLEQIWKPYFSAIAGSWANPRSGNSSFLCPFV